MFLVRATLALFLMTCAGIMQTCPVVLASSTEARTNCAAQMFFKAYFDFNVYESGHCHVNASRLVRYFQANLKDSFKMEDATILYFFVIRKKGVHSFNATSSRGGLENPGDGSIERWGWHTVVKYQGEIYDLDFDPTGELAPKIVSEAEFISTVFLPNQPQLYKREIPVNVFLEHNHWNFGSNSPFEEQYPSFPVFDP